MKWTGGFYAVFAPDNRVWIHSIRREHKSKLQAVVYDPTLIGIFQTRERAEAVKAHMEAQRRKR